MCEAAKFALDNFEAYTRGLLLFSESCEDYETPYFYTRTIALFYGLQKPGERPARDHEAEFKAWRAAHADRLFDPGIAFYTSEELAVREWMCAQYLIDYNSEGEERARYLAELEAR